MKLNKILLDQFKNTDSKILAVTKYFDKDTTANILNELENEYADIFVWVWENRLQVLREKNIDREKAHFIWNLQTKELKHVIDFASTIHSLDSLKKAKKLNELCELKNTWVKVFIQINLDESKPWGIKPIEFGNFLIALDDFENLWVMWISWMWKNEFTLEEKEKEFDLLLELRNKYIQKWLISAGTSVDYEIAIKKRIDIIRVWNKLFLEE